MNRGQKYAALIFICAALLSGIAGWMASSVIDEGARLEAETALKAAGWDWAKVEADGFTLTLTGEAPDAAARESAVALLAKAAGGQEGGVITISDETTVRPAPPPPPAPEAKLTIMRGVGDISVIGIAPGRAALDGINAALAAAAPDLVLNDMSLTTGKAAKADWAGIAAPAAEIAAALSLGLVELEAGKITLSGIADDPESFNRIDEAMTRAEDAGWNVISDLSSPPPPPTAFVLRARIGGDNPGMSECTATNAEQADQLTTRAAALGGKTVECKAGAGAPEGWGKAAEAALAALATLPAGEVSLIGDRARLTAAAPTSNAGFERAAEALRRDLPAGYSFISLTDAGEDGEAPLTQEEEADQDLMIDVPPLEMQYDGERFRVSGAVPDTLLAESITAFARAAMPGAQIETEFADGESFPPAWREAAMAMITVLGHLDSGFGRIEGNSLAIEGGITDPLALPGLQQTLVDAAGDTITVETKITVSPASIAASQPLPPRAAPVS